MKISTKWFHGLPKEDHDEFRKTILSYDRDPVLRQLKKIIESKLAETNKTNTTDYDKASWPFYQAHKNGQQEALNDLITLLGVIGE